MQKNHVASNTSLLKEVLEDTEEIQDDTDAIIEDTEDIQSTVNDIEADVAAVQDTVNDIETDVAAVDTVVDAIKVTTDALFTLTETGGTLTTDGNEQNLYVNNAPAGVFRPVGLKVDFTNHTVAETVVLKTYYRIKTGGTLRLQDEATFTGVQDPVLINIDLEPNRFGLKVTIERTGGGNKAYDWEVFYEV